MESFPDSLICCDILAGSARRAALLGAATAVATSVASEEAQAFGKNPSDWLGYYKDWRGFGEGCKTSESNHSWFMKHELLSSKSTMTDALHFCDPHAIGGSF